MRIHRTFALFAVTAALACGEGEDRADEAGAIDSAAMLRSAAGRIHAGMSQDEVRNTLGEPRTRVTMNGGFERWTYYSYDAQGQTAARTLIIFGNDGKVVEINEL
ncbi:MAG: outer membrane protein assembly factor BamE [Gemmatimonadetes bacterium]|nr:outer membrane protein assembly factor BamE [Gemmatimonadota bacterium]